MRWVMEENDYVGRILMALEVFLEPLKLGRLGKIRLVAVQADEMTSPPIEGVIALVPGQGKEAEIEG